MKLLKPKLLSILLLSSCFNYSFANENSYQFMEVNNKDSYYNYITIVKENFKNDLMDNLSNNQFFADQADFKGTYSATKLLNEFNKNSARVERDLSKKWIRFKSVAYEIKNDAYNNLLIIAKHDTGFQKVNIYFQDKKDERLFDLDVGQSIDFMCKVRNMVFKNVAISNCMFTKDYINILIDKIYPKNEDIKKPFQSLNFEFLMSHLHYKEFEHVYEKACLENKMLCEKEIKTKKKAIENGFMDTYKSQIQTIINNTNKDYNIKI